MTSSVQPLIVAVALVLRPARSKTRPGAALISSGASADRWAVRRSQATSATPCSRSRTINHRPPSTVLARRRIVGPEQVPSCVIGSLARKHTRSVSALRETSNEEDNSNHEANFDSNAYDVPFRQRRIVDHGGRDQDCIA